MSRFLLTGDVEAEAEHLLLTSGQRLSARVLKVTHRGSGDSSAADFLVAVDPLYAVISVGAENRFGRPQDDVLARLGQLGDVTVRRTDERDTVEFVTDGQRLWCRRSSSFLNLGRSQPHRAEPTTDGAGSRRPSPLSRGSHALTGRGPR